MILRERRAEMSLQVKGQEELLRGFRERRSILTALLMLPRRWLPHRSLSQPSLLRLFNSSALSTTTPPDGEITPLPAKRSRLTYTAV